MVIENTPYSIEVDWVPAHELLISLQAYVSRTEHKTLELGLGWVRQVRERLRPDTAAELAERHALAGFDLLALLVRQCSGDRTPEAFLERLAAMPVGELYERLAPHAVDYLKDMPADLAAWRDRSVRLLTAWNDQYFRTVDLAILAGLAADAEAKRALAGRVSAQEVVEQATKGVHFLPEGGLETVVLIPQYHYRPWNLFSDFKRLRLTHYPVDAIPVAPGEPPPGILRLASALSDESRLRILYALAERPRSFTELVGLTKLSKGTVHHHMVALRAAGLVLVDSPKHHAATYSLRPKAIDELGERLHAYLHIEGARS
jgi:DNA-binding transcriptional ArsR family regulator